MSVYTLHVHIDAGFVYLAWLSGAVLCWLACWCHVSGVGVSPLTFGMPPTLAWQKPPKLVQSGRGPWWNCSHILAEGGLSVYERLLIVWRWCCSTHTESGLCHCGGMSSTSWCAFWCCWACVVVALFVDFRWSVKILWRMGVLEQHVLGVSMCTRVTVLTLYVKCLLTLFHIYIWQNEPTSLFHATFSNL